MPQGFKGTNAIGAPAVWVPYMTYQQTTTGFFLELIRPDQRRGLVFNVTGRLKPGVSVRQAEANLKTLARQLEQEYPNDNKGRNVTLVPLAQATINPGFRTSKLLSLAINPPLNGYSVPATRTFFKNLQQTLGELPGVQSIISCSEPSMPWPLRIR